MLFQPIYKVKNIFKNFIFFLSLIPATSILIAWITIGCEVKKTISEITIDNPFIVGNRPPVSIAHRGGSGEYPEETLLAFNHASRLGIDYLEMDVRLTFDNQLVVHHDSLIDRTSDGLGAVLELKLEDLRKFNFANNFTNQEGVFPYRDTGRPQRISTIEEIFRQFPNYRMIIEIKDTGTEGKVASDLLYKSIIKYKKQSHVIVSSFNEEIMNFFRQQSGGMIITMAALKESLWFYLSYFTGIDSLYEKKSDILALPTSMFGFDLSKKELITDAHRRNLAVHYWTINDKETMMTLINNGADGIMTDYPTLLLNVITSISQVEQSY